VKHDRILQVEGSQWLLCAGVDQILQEVEGARCFRNGLHGQEALTTQVWEVSRSRYSRLRRCPLAVRTTVVEAIIRHAVRCLPATCGMAVSEAPWGFVSQDREDSQMHTHGAMVHSRRTGADFVPGILEKDLCYCWGRNSDKVGASPQVCLVIAAAGMAWSKHPVNVGSD
jgi:hypothetical protein